MADAAFAIVNAVQGSDATLVAVRSKAASAFTNAIETTGTGYAGEGGADVGRALIASISAGSSDADITRAVDAAATLSDIVSTQPGVLSALIGSGSLLDLFSTTRGGTDAVTLLEVLGRLGELAQSDPSGLQAILRGGDITQMLSALPSTTSLQQLLEALNSGGFSGGAAVIYPPPLSPPSAPLNVTITFESVMSHADDTEPNDAVTRICVAYVQFDVAGTVPAGHKFEYSIDNGVTWHVAALVGTKVIVTGVNLGNGTQHTDYLATEIKLRIVDGSGTSVHSYSKEIHLDSTAPAGVINFVQIGDGPVGVMTTTSNVADVTFRMSGHGSDAIAQWRYENDQSWAKVDTIASDGSFTLAGIDLSAADRTLELRLIDAAGNASAPVTEFRIDGPVAPSIILVKYSLISDPAAFNFDTDYGFVTHAPGTANGFIDSAGLTLSDLSSGEAKSPSKNYLDGVKFGEGSSLLLFDSMLALGLYRLDWTGSTFYTSAGNVKAGSLLFAGGVAANFVEGGFTVNSLEYLDSDSNSLDTTASNTAYFHLTENRYSLFTGGGQDVVVDGGGVLDLGYRAFAAGASDLIMGFDRGSDIISFHGAAATALDRNLNGALDWVSSASGKPAVTNATEAVSFVTAYTIFNAPTYQDGTVTFSTINASINFSAMDSSKDLLLLAANAPGDYGALMMFRDSNGNKRVDQDELTFIAVFDDGVPLTTDIAIVGTVG